MSTRILKALIIGVVAGIIDMVPMFIQGLDIFSDLAAFTHWLVLGLIIPFINWPLQGWIKGIVAGLLMAVPTVLMVLPVNRLAVFPITLFSIILGAAVGFVGEKWI
jgi:hypothetical protein